MYGITENPSWCNNVYCLREKGGEDGDYGRDVWNRSTSSKSYKQMHKRKIKKVRNSFDKRIKER